MTTYIKLSVGALAAALAAVGIRRQNAELAMLLGVAGCCLGGLLAIELLRPVLEFCRRLFTQTGMAGELLSPLLKTTGVALLTQLSGAVCADAGQSALARLVELGGTVLCLTLALPLMTAVLELIEQLVRT